MRVATDSWKATGDALHSMGFEYFCFLSAIDWMPSPYGRGEDDPTEPPPERSTEIRQGVTGGETRFQVFARVTDIHRHVGVTIKVDVPDDTMAIESWFTVYAGANWHERETHEMFGIGFTGHPDLRNMYLPTEFEGYPLRKDFPLLARMVKPWPGHRRRRADAGRGPAARGRGRRIREPGRRHARPGRRRARASHRPRTSPRRPPRRSARGRRRTRRRRPSRIRRARRSRTHDGTSTASPATQAVADRRSTGMTDLLSERQQLSYIASQAADARLNVELETEGMTLNIGPQHPATHGTLRIIVRLDGEQVVWAEPSCGYMHRGYEKLTEVRTYPQVTTLVNRIDWLGSFANEVPFILAAEKLMEIEAPPRAQHIRTILFELSRIANIVLFLGDLGVQLGAVTPAFFAFRDREHVLNLIETVTGGRFHPNFDRIGGLKDDLPKGFIDECRLVMRKIRTYCDEIEDLLIGGEIFQARTRGVGDHPTRGRPAVRAVRRQPARQRRRLGPAPRPGPADGVGQGRLEGLDPSGRRQLRPLLGPPAGDPRVDEDRRPAARRPAGRVDHGQGPAHHQGAGGRGLGLDREPARRDGLLHRQPRRPRPVPGEDPLGQLQQHLDRAVGAARRLRPGHHHDPGVALLHPGDIDR